MVIVRKFFGAAAAAIALAAGSTAAAQQNIDEPRLDPIFGQPREEAPEEHDHIQTDDEFDHDKGWHPLRGFVGILTFMAPSNTDLSLGVGPAFAPDHFGSDDYKFRVDPEVYVKFRNFVFLDDDGGDVALFGFSGFAFGPSFRLVGDRDDDDNPALRGLGDVDHTFELGGFAATKFADSILFRTKIRKGIAGGHHGLIVDAAGSMLLMRYGRFSTGVSAKATWVGNRYADVYFSITPEQSLASGLPVYDAPRGLRDVGGSLNGYINIRKRWSMNPYVSYSYIFDDFAKTPFIDFYGDRNQFVAGFHLMREFEFNWR
jgi:outer membrane scaffolding protein for murein synthesis (MipA/OmpV family)